ncbi:hypothetical protein McanCB49686_007337 [Microsporum canis]
MAKINAVVDIARYGSHWMPKGGGPEMQMFRLLLLRFYHALSKCSLVQYTARYLLISQFSEDSVHLHARETVEGYEFVSRCMLIYGSSLIHCTSRKCLQTSYVWVEVNITEILFKWPSVQSHTPNGDTQTLTNSDTTIFADDERLHPPNSSPID